MSENPNVINHKRLKLDWTWNLWWIKYCGIFTISLLSKQAYNQYFILHFSNTHFVLDIVFLWCIDRDICVIGKEFRGSKTSNHFPIWLGAGHLIFIVSLSPATKWEGYFLYLNIVTDGMFVSPANSCVDTLPMWWHYFAEIIRNRWGHKGEALKWDQCPYESF